MSTLPDGPVLAFDCDVRWARDIEVARAVNVRTYLRYMSSGVPPLARPEGHLHILRLEHYFNDSIDSSVVPTVTATKIALHVFSVPTPLCNATIDEEPLERLELTYVHTTPHLVNAASSQHYSSSPPSVHDNPRRAAYGGIDKCADI